MSAEQVLLDIRKLIDGYFSQTQQTPAPQQVTPQPIATPIPPTPASNAEVIDAPWSDALGYWGRIAKVMTTDQVCAIRFGPYSKGRKYFSITVSTGHDGMQTPAAVICQISETPGDFTPHGMIPQLSGGRIAINSGTFRVSFDPELHYGRAVLDPTKTYYFNFKFESDGGAHIDFI